MHTRLLPILAATLLLSACGNKADLLQPRQVPPEDRGRYIFKSSIPTQEQLDAEEDAAWEDDAEEDSIDDGTTDEATGTPPAQPVPLIRDVPPATTGTP
ncbi:integrator complex subunit 13 [Luteimonas sp. XNQY3]|nr:integrator complex subunit 13 [Luteimonas sp. XNQY3]MCD9006104.1 integrator complex subunit 13 [Luteimonas sp. XNQY3]